VRLGPSEGSATAEAGSTCAPMPTAAGKSAAAAAIR